MADINCRRGKFELLNKLSNHLFFVWLLVATCFGGLLFFSSNHNLMNPVMPFWPSAIKDIAWFFLVLLIAFKGQFYNDFNAIKYSFFAMTLLLIAMTCFSIFRNEGSLDLGYLRALKNAFLYSTLPLLLVFYKGLSYDRIVRYIRLALSISLLISIAVYYIFEQSYKPGNGAELRMFGVTGNPNNASCMAVILLVIALVGLARLSLYSQFISFVIAFLALALSASLMYVGFALALIFFYGLLLYFSELKNDLKSLIGILIISVLTAWLLGMVLNGITEKSGFPLGIRLESMVAQDKQVGISKIDSVRIRSQDWNSVVSSDNVLSYRQFDSGILNYYKNFGLFGLLFCVLPIGCALISVLSMRKMGWCIKNEGLQMLLLISILFLISGMLHFQISIFPCNVLLQLIIVFSWREICWLNLYAKT